MLKSFANLVNRQVGALAVAIRSLQGDLMLEGGDKICFSQHARAGKVAGQFLALHGSYGHQLLPLPLVHVPAEGKERQQDHYLQQEHQQAKPTSLMQLLTSNMHMM